MYESNFSLLEVILTSNVKLKIFVFDFVPYKSDLFCSQKEVLTLNQNNGLTAEMSRIAFKLLYCRKSPTFSETDRPDLMTQKTSFQTKFSTKTSPLQVPIFFLQKNCIMITLLNDMGK